MSRIGRREFLGVCAAACGAVLTACATESTTTASGKRSRRSDGGPVIDVHAHWHAPGFVNLLEKEGAANGAKIGRNARGDLTFAGGSLLSVFAPQYMDLSIRLKHMDEQVIDVHALSLTSPMVYWAPPAFALKLSQVYNDELVRAHREYPTRFVGLAMIPMNAPQLAIQELDR